MSGLFLYVKKTINLKKNVSYRYTIFVNKNEIKILTYNIPIDGGECTESSV